MTICAPWVTEADLCTPCDDYDVDMARMDSALEAASDVLYQLSGQQFPGLCEQTIRPCTQQVWNSVWRESLSLNFPYRTFGYPACGCSDKEDKCGCRWMSYIELPNAPVAEVTEVKLDGVVLVEELDYDLSGNQLRRLNGKRWPCCQDFSLPDTEPDTWSVSYSYGREPPAIGVRAAAVLACELYMACNPEEFEGQCRLPRNAVQIARQGVTVLVQNAQDLFSSRRGQPTHFGIWEIDMFLRAHNPYGVSSRVTILSPDLPPTGRKVT